MSESKKTEKGIADEWLHKICLCKPYLLIGMNAFQFSTYLYPHTKLFNRSCVRIWSLYLLMTLLISHVSLILASCIIIS